MTPREELDKLDRGWIDEQKRHGSVSHLQMLPGVASLLIFAGVAMISFGAWLWDRGLDPRFDEPGGSCMFLGACVVIGSLVFRIRSGRRLQAYIRARLRYESRREQLLQDIYASERVLENPEDDTNSQQDDEPAGKPGR